MLSRRVALSTRRAVFPSSSLTCQRRTFFGSHLLNNVLAHDAGLVHAATYTSLGTLAMSPLGTAALVVVSYNTCVVGLKHLWMTLEFLVRDYLQDPILVQTFRYMILVTLMLCCAQLFIEV
jgi:hypothetical protein